MLLSMGHAGVQVPAAHLLAPPHHDVRDIILITLTGCETGYSWLFDVE